MSTGFTPSRVFISERRLKYRLTWVLERQTVLLISDSVFSSLSHSETKKDRSKNESQPFTERTVCGHLVNLWSWVSCLPPEVRIGFSKDLRLFDYVGLVNRERSICFLTFRILEMHKNKQRKMEPRKSVRTTSRSRPSPSKTDSSVRYNFVRNTPFTRLGVPPYCRCSITVPGNRHDGQSKRWWVRVHPRRPHPSNSMFLRTGYYWSSVLFPTK